MDPSEIKSLVAARRPESLQIDYKRELSAWNDAAKSEFLADVSAMANAVGGTILYGISEVDGCANEIVGISGNDLDGLRLRIDGIIRSGIEPRLQHISLAFIDVDGAIVLEISVPRSLSRPHWVSARGERRFYIRTSVGKAPMSIDEVRSAFQSAGDVIERASQWRRDSVQHLNSVAGNLVTNQDDVWMVLHLCPLSAFAGLLGATFDARPPQDHTKRLRTISTDNTNCRSHYKGLITEEHRGLNNELRERLLVYRDYRVEAVWRAGGKHDHGKLIYASSNELRINNWLTHFLGWTRESGYPFPALAFLSVLNAQESCIYSMWHPQAATSDTMELRPAFLEDANVQPATAMRETYDHLWQSYGYDECILYDEAGRFDQQRYDPRRG